MKLSLTCSLRYIFVFRWVSIKTNNVIESIVSPEDITPTTRLLLVSTIYFKAEWQVPFPPASRGNFYLGENEYLEVPMLKNRLQVNIANIPQLDATAVELPYKGNKVKSSLLKLNSTATYYKDDIL